MAIFFRFRTFLAWILPLPATCFAAGFLGNYYSTFFAVAMTALVMQVVLGLLVHVLLGKALDLYIAKPRDFVLGLALFIMLFVFMLGMFGMALQFPSLFKTGVVFLEREQVLPYILGAMLAVPCLAWLLERENIK